MPLSLLRLRHPHRNRYSLTAPLGAQRNSRRCGSRWRRARCCLPAAAAGRWSSRSAVRWSSGSAATGSGSSWAAQPASMRRSARRWPTQRAAPTRCSSAARSASAHGAAGPRGCSPRRWCPRASRPGRRWRGAPCGWSSAARWWWLVVLFPERPADRQWGPGSRLAYRSALYHLKPTFVAASQPPVAPAFCQLAPADLFATVDGYWVVPHTFRDGLCDDEY